MKTLWLIAAAIAAFLGSGMAVQGQEEAEKPPEIPVFKGKVLGMELEAERLGIVLDVSQSMAGAMPWIQAELKGKLPRSPVLHVDGCKLEKPEPRPQIINGLAPETVTAVDMLASVGKVDAVLWICDMGDASNRYGVVAMEEVLAKYGIQFYVLSIGKRPSPSIRKLAEGTDGWWTVTSPPESE